MAERQTRKDRNKAKYRDIVRDTEGNYVYTGEMFRIAGNRDAMRIRLSVLLAAVAVSVIASGCIDAAGANDAFYVILPYIGEVSAAFALVWNAVKVIARAGGIRKYVLDSVTGMIPGACRMLMVFALAGCLMSAVYLFRNGMGAEPFKSIVYIIFKIITAALAETYARVFASAAWEPA